MAEIYGHKWGSQYGDYPTETWMQGLSDLGMFDVLRGLSACMGRHDPWPPNLAEFRQLCTGDDGQGWERQCHKIYEPERLLEDHGKKALAKAGRDACMAELAEFMGGAQ